MSHTPGPWEAIKASGNADRRNNVATLDYEFRIVTHLTPDADEVAANARLIALAPELLDVLEAYEEISGPSWNELRKQYIAKAEGK